jgi:hypothetical protein
MVKDAAGTVLPEERYTSDVRDRGIGVGEDSDGAGVAGAESTLVPRRAVR